MRVNLPVTNAEYVLPDGEVIVSRTDTKGRITYVNESFTRSSGFSREESMGQPQNFIRHPDMPAEAFADLWVTIKAGKPWSALVKNRRKDGGFYWVKANVTPMVDGGRITGYMSVRTKPSRNEIDGAETLYRKMRDGRLTGMALQGGELVRTGLLGKLERLTRIPLVARQSVIYGTLTILYGATAAVAMAQGGPGHQVVAILSALGACLAVGFAVRFASKVAAPLAQAEDIAGRVAGGDLSLWFPHRGDRALVRLFGMLDQMNAKLVGVLKDVSASVSSVQSAATEISKGNSDLSQRTEEQASSLEETASSMEQLTGTVKENAEHSKQANELAAGSSAVALKGGEVVGRVITTMSSINQSSKKIADIIGVIDGIAFQTNILALNAAVEAARAGEQGRGFAVVAAEVRSLAQRSAAAAKEIKELITSSVENVDSGTKLVEQAGGTMDEIVASVKRVTDIIAEISAASQEQSTGIEQVSQAIAQMDEVTQQNAALVEQVAAATESLEGQARVVSDAMGAFNLGLSAPATAHHAATVTKLRSPAAPKAAPIAGNTTSPRKVPKVANSRTGDDWEQF